MDTTPTSILAATTLQHQYSFLSTTTATAHAQQPQPYYYSSTTTTDQFYYNHSSSIPSSSSANFSSFDNDNMGVGEWDGEEKALAMLRQPLHLLIIYCVAYGLVFVLGLIGNIFVVVAVVWNPSMRNITNYFITSLAVADLLIIIFCLPATLMNNILTEWLLGNFLCKMSVWVNGTTSCTSVYTLVAVTADRYFAICHTMRYNVFEKRRSLCIIIPIWLLSGILFIPSLLYFEKIDYPIPGTNISARICFPKFPSPEMEKNLFLVANFLIAFLVPLIAITVCYTFIFVAIFRHTSIAVDLKAAEREHRIKMRVTNMMLTVIILFAASWLPLYLLFTYIYFGQPTGDNSEISRMVANIFRPVFQWLSLANSCINPILYAYFSNKFRRAFQEILVLPCRRRYARVQNFARRTMKRYSSRGSHSDYNNPSTTQQTPAGAGGGAGIDPEQTRLILPTKTRSFSHNYSRNGLTGVGRGGGSGTSALMGVTGGTGGPGGSSSNHHAVLRHINSHSSSSSTGNGGSSRRVRIREQQNNSPIVPKNGRTGSSYQQQQPSTTKFHHQRSKSAVTNGTRKTTTTTINQTEQQHQQYQPTPAQIQRRYNYQHPNRNSTSLAPLPTIVTPESSAGAPVRVTSGITANNPLSVLPSYNNKIGHHSGGVSVIGGSSNDKQQSAECWNRVAPVLTMKDLDVSSVSITISLNHTSSIDSISTNSNTNTNSNNLISTNNDTNITTANNCHLRFVQIRDMTTV